MFRCIECNKEYDIKPDFCDDCGNDVFEEILPVPKTVEKPVEKETSEAKISQTINEDLFQKQDSIKQSTAQTAAPVQIKPESVASWLFFLTCLMLSFAIIFFINPPEKEEEKVVEKPVEETLFIPSLDSFWNNEKPKSAQIQASTPKKQEQQLIAKVVEPQIIKPKEVETKPQNQQPKTTKVELKYFPNVNNTKNTQPKKTNTTVSTKPKQTQPQKQSQQQTQQQTKPKTTQTKTTTQTAQVQKPVQNQQTAKQSNIQVQTKTQPVQNQQTVAKTQTAPVQNTQTVNTQVSKKELTTYKANLRNTIGKKIDFANVVGDGSCTVSFKIDSNGKLINRSFSKQSSNTTLNDAVYKAVMQTPSYNPPPAAYNGETMSLKTSFYNGNFEVTLN